MRNVATPAQHEFAARAELFVDALTATLEGVTDDEPSVQPSVRRIGQVIAEAAREAAIFDIESVAMELAAAAYIERSHILHLVDLIETTVSDRPPRRSILVVEDDDISAMVLHAIGHETQSAATVANTLAEARQALTGWIPDLIVMDLFLPDGDGRSFLAELRSDPRLCHIPVIVVSGFDHELARAESLALGADHFMAKPFEPEALMDIFNSVMPHSRRVSSALVTRGLLLREFSAGLGDQSVAMVRFHPVAGPGEPMGAKLLAPAAEAFALSVIGDGLVAEWSDGLFCAVIDAPVDEAAELLDEVRRRLRNDPVANNRCTFAAGLTAASGDGFMRAAGKANSLLQQGEREGGDRVVREVNRTRPTIVLAEDDSLIAALVTGRLEARGFEVSHTADGLDAIDLIGRSMPSLVLLDLLMPGADGFDVLRKLKGNPATADIPVIILTGSDGEASVVKAFELGASDYVMKPFSPAELMVRIERFFR